jgi:hypothetical protein
MMTNGGHNSAINGMQAIVFGCIEFYTTQVRNTPSWPRSWANFGRSSLYSRRNAWANLHLLGQPNSFLASVFVRYYKYGGFWGPGR